MPAKKAKQRRFKKLVKTSNPPRPAGVQIAFEEGIVDAAEHLTGGDRAEKFKMDKYVSTDGEKKTEQYKLRRSRKRTR